ncbi:MAG: DNA (cytosine-5-)-methyltransferase [Tenericutes bacterium HGW-Tenericutes-1]|jgi:DNA (cytosine-5)-methyltransferase 1|nr:MAG: DNA (cytosine-5-)-methyltransferase [Tenericutes bacterium HGW-Tenericutes-1]
MNEKNFKFIDLFSGIGGFHQALSSLGGQCVFSSEIDKECINVYNKNYNISSDYDITKVDETKIPFHDVLCAGFPCQTFSKAGKQAGVNDTRGTLFFEIERILRYHHTKYIILENVRNLVSHDHGNTWKVIKNILHDIGYRLTVEPLILSPHQFGIPQIRDRVYILGVFNPEYRSSPINIAINEMQKKDMNSIDTVLDHHRVDQKYYISDYERYVLGAWDDFYKGIKEKIIGFPIWSEFFRYSTPPENFPAWKKVFVQKNIDLYLNNMDFIDRWLIENDNLEDFAPTHRKFEWQAGTKIKSLWDGVIQFRPSGIRVKKPDVFPALVAIVQIPVIGKYKRRLTVRECARLQSFPDSFIPSDNLLAAYKQFGNSVNVDVVKYLANYLLNTY